MFLPEIYMHLQRFSDAAPDRTAVGLDTVDRQPARRPTTSLLASRHAPDLRRPATATSPAVEPSQDVPTQPVPPRAAPNEWDDWKSVRDVA